MSITSQQEVTSNAGGPFAQALATIFAEHLDGEPTEADWDELEHHFEAEADMHIYLFRGAAILKVAHRNEHFLLYKDMNTEPFATIQDEP